MDEKNYVFFGMKEIMKAYKIGSEDKFYNLVKLGMPVKKIVGTWTGTQKNINKWFDEKTHCENI